MLQTAGVEQRTLRPFRRCKGPREACACGCAKLIRAVA